MNNLVSCDLAIIGAGAAGLSVAAGAAQLGAKVVIIESGKMGGDCLNYGCVPSKSLLAAAKNFWHIKQAQHFGIDATATVNFSQVMAHVKNVMATIAVNDSVERFENLGVKVILATAKFIDEKTLQAAQYRITAKKFVIATGSSPFIPSIPGLENITYYTNETIFDLTAQPKHLIVIGGGPIGCELAQAFAMLGSAVTLIASRKLLPKDEPDCVEIIRQQLVAMNINIHEYTQTRQINRTQNEINLAVKKQDELFEITGTHLLIATGRRINVQALNLESANVAYTTKGVTVDKYLRTTNKKVYAIGDVVGSFQFTHVASFHASIVLKNCLFKLFSKIDYRCIPWVTYTTPELAHVGLTFEEAKKQYDKVAITEWPFCENDRANTERVTLGKIKIITNNKAKILGVTIVGANAGELLLPWIIAMRENKSLRALTDIIIPYPTLSEINKRVASEFYAPLLFSKKIRWLVKMLSYI